VDAITTVAAFAQPAPSTDERLAIEEYHSDAPALSVTDDVARDALAIVDAALPQAHRAMLDFERAWWRRGGAKEQAIRDTFGLTPTRYYQALNGVLDLPAAMVYDAALVHRLRRVRAQATRGRRSLD
jgi:hypothetical protein